MNKKEKIIGSDNNYTQNTYTNTSLSGELKSIQRSIALQQQTLTKIVNLVESLAALRRLSIGGF